MSLTPFNQEARMRGQLACLMSLILSGRNAGLQTEIIISNQLRDPNNTLPEGFYDVAGQMRLKLSTHSTGLFKQEEEIGCLFVQTAFNRQKTEVFIPVGSIVAVILDNQVVWETSALFIYKDTRSTQNPESNTKSTVHQLFKK